MLEEIEDEQNRIDDDTTEKLMHVDEVEEIVQQNVEIHRFDSEKFRSSFLEFSFCNSFFTRMYSSCSSVE